MKMKIVVLALAVAALPVGAGAAQAWECQGPFVACGGAEGSSGSSYKSPKTSYKASKKNYRSDDGYSSGGGSSSSGKASYYWEPQQLASGGRFNPNAMTAAHKTLPFGTKVRVTNRNNGESVVVTINDRGPYVGGRIIDLSRAAAQAISMTGAGVAPVTVTVLGRG